MSKNRYEQDLLQRCTELDAITGSGGKVVDCAKSIVAGNDENSKVLCKIIGKASELSNPKITLIAIEIKNSLLQFYGYQRLTDICNDRSDDENEFTLEQLTDQLNHLIGLTNVKSKVNDLIAFHKVQLLRKNKGLRVPKGTMHLAFTGNPGTGKTTVARIVGRIYKKLGLLTKGHFTEVSRTDLIAEYQGQTAHKVKKVIERAKGGVLFIDEAYSISENDHSDSYGRECLTELTKALEDYREDLVVIVAGYTEPMKQFFESNPGLRSRFNTFIEFDDYNATELIDIFKSMSEADDYVTSECALEKLLQNFEHIICSKEGSFANARYVRNIFESMVMNQARRVSQIISPTILELKLLTEIDIT